MIPAALSRPWFDAFCVRAVTRIHLPLSRGWAAAVAADGDAERFGADTGIASSARGLARALNRTSALARAYATADSVWKEAFFAPEPSGADRLRAAERARGKAATRFMLARRAFLPWIRRLPSVRWSIASPAGLEDRHGSRLAAPGSAYPPPPPTSVKVSHAIEARGRRQYWLRFPSPVLGDTAWAHVSEPLGVADPPTLVLLHGVNVETEMWPRVPDPMEMALADVRIVRPEGPWHGRRMETGRYGGEAVMARAPEGMIALLQAWVPEAALLIQWAREAGSRRVAIGGVSLGALTSQMLSTVCRHWPGSQRPDAAFLVATTGQLLDVVFSGSLADGIGLPGRLEKAGWDRAALERWLPLLQPEGPPVMGPENVVMVLGDADDLTPYAGGLALARQWGLPAENLFLRHQGHFSVVVGLAPDPAPLHRLDTLLRA
jgi:hypothetical protein